MPFKTIEDRRAYARAYHARNPHKYDAVRKAWAAKNRPPKGRIKRLKTEEEWKASRSLDREKYKEWYANYRKEYNQRPEVKARKNRRAKEIRALDRANRPRVLLTEDEKANRRAEYRRKRWAALKADPQKLAAHNANKRDNQKRQWEIAKQDPAAIEELRKRNREAGARWMARLKETDPAKYALTIEQKKEKDRQIKAEKRKQPGYYAKQNAWFRKRRSESPAFKLAQAIRCTMNSALRGRYKAGTFMERVGCTAGELKEHLEKQFTEGMVWENFGNRIGCWTMDHILPCASFDLSDPEQQKKCFHYTNIRPMWHTENCSKNSIIDGRKHYHDDHALPPCNPDKQI